MTDPDKMADKLAAALRKALEDGQEPYVFTNDEVRELQAIIVLVRKFRALHWFGRWAFWVVVGVGTLVLNWERIKDVFFR